MTTLIRKLLMTAAAAFVMAAGGALSASAAGGSAAGGAMLPSYSSSVKVDAVKDCKADPTGAADSTAALQKALDNAKTKASDQKCVIVNVPAGTYRITQSLRIYSNTQLILDDNATFLKCFDNGCIIYNVGTDGGYSGGYSTTSNVLIQGGKWDGNTDNYSNVYTFSNIRLAHANNIIFRNMTVLNNKNGHHMEIGGVQGLTIEGCYFSGYTGTLLKEAIQLDVMNSSELFVGFEPFDDTACDNVVIRNCTFADIPRGIGSHSAVAGAYYTNVSILNNSFTGISNICMVLYNYKHCTISGNTISNSGAGITFNYMSDENFRHFFPPVNGFGWALDRIDSNADTVITNNNITTQSTWLQSYPYGIKVYGASVNGNNNYPAANYYISNIDVRNNTVNCADTALQMTNVYDSAIADNLFTANGAVTCNEAHLASLNYCYRNNVTGNNIKGSLKSALSVTNSGENKMTKNTLSGCAGVGVLIENSSGCEIKSNSISDNTTGGIKIGSGCAETTCASNVIKTSGGYGIKVTECGSGKDIKVKSNDISGVGNGIMLVNSGKAYLSGNSFEAVTDKVYADADGLVTLLKPKDFDAEEVTSDRIKLTWKAISEADGIHVYRRQAGSMEFENIASVDSGSIFQDERLVSGTNYYYKIVPYIEYDKKASETRESDVIESRTKVSLETAQIDCIDAAAFTSKPVVPKFTVSANGEELTPGVDFDYKYSDNVYAGTAVISITGKGDYIGTAEHRYEITLGAPQVSDAAKRIPAAVGKTQKRIYNVKAERRPEMLIASGNARTAAAQRTVDSVTAGSHFRMYSSAAVWDRGGYEQL